MDIINFAYSLFSDPYSWMAALVFFMGYTYTTKVDNTTAVIASHINLLQTEKIDRDGEVEFTGTSQWDKGADVASASPLVLTSDGNYHDVTGTADIDEITAAQSQPGTIKKLHFDDILKIVHDGDKIILPDGKDIYTMAGTELEFICYATNKWRCTGYLRGVPVFLNLLINSGFGVWSKSDTNKGVGTMAYDQGSKGAGTAPSVGDAAVGGTSGAVAKLISYTIATGDWATNDATGIFTLGACAGRFHDNETVTFGGVETAVVNQPNSSAGVDLVRNGEYSVDTDPTPGWTASNATLSTEAGGSVGNCMKVLDGGAGNGYGCQQITTVVGKIYKFLCWAKDIDTGQNGLIEVGTAAGDDTYYSSGTITDDAGDTYAVTFEATTTTTFITFNCTTAGGTYYFDEVSCYEITPCSTSTSAAMDGWIRGGACNLYRQHNDGGMLTKDGTFYSLMVVPIAASDFIQYPLSTIINNAEWNQQFAGKLVTYGMWMKTSTASHARVNLYDGANNFSSYHSGGGNWEWIEKTITVSASVTAFQIAISFTQAGMTNGNTIIYISPPILAFGSHLGEGNYQAQQQEVVFMEKKIPSNLLDGKTSLSDVAVTNLNIEADSDAMLPKGCKRIKILTQCNDAGSAGTDCYLRLRSDPTKTYEYYNSPYGRANDADERVLGWQQCDTEGDVDYNLEASGANTFDIDQMDYVAAQVN